MAVGDGANDVEMLKAVHYGVAYHAKAPAVAAAKATCTIRGSIPLRFSLEKVGAKLPQTPQAQKKRSNGVGAPFRF